MTKMSKKTEQVIYGMISADAPQSKVAKMIGIGEHTAGLRVTRYRDRNGFKTKYKLFYELGRRDQMTELYGKIRDNANLGK